jgi:hypothetical protein
MIDFNEFAENTGYEFGMMRKQALTERPRPLSHQRFDHGFLPPALE